MNEDAWDERYAAADRLWSGRPNPALVAEVGDLAPGTALDVGCGEGADAVWLAQRGWRVTGLDISGVALERGRAWATDNDVEVTWVRGDLLGAGLPAGSFDLVAALYPPLARTASAEAERSMAALVAPGGRLLVVHHALPAPGEEHHHRASAGEGEPHRPDFAAMVAPASVLPVLGEGWVVEVDEERDRAVDEGAGAHHLRDVVLLAHRTALA